ncbi:hypothetical protein [Paenibacillus hexagrammi]|uniref:Uncharacterized protein n=1 Tax=Paenibacillus hexagrammi TaxID=2908839 RepID=A0ABY3SP00_9BACL|nr:hypothetical protein [Paenibacillus sp. YPD9-1]UJF35783.1 hypothetical protein L0M14_12265 [Paenibacillus sp. YPD9-1]
MNDVIMIVAGVSYSSKSCVISCFDSTVDLPILQIGAHASQVIKELLNEGFEVYSTFGNGNSITYLLIREEEDPPSDGILAGLVNRINTLITVFTAAGAESGTLTMIGTDFIELQGLNGDLILIPAVSILAYI